MKLNQTYNREEFVSFLKNDFLPDFISDTRDINSLKTKTIQSAKYLGECLDLELQIFEFKTTGKSEKKISQALDSFKILREYQSYKALVVYYSEDDRNWRFAFLQMTPDMNDMGKIATKFSNPRRYSFLLGPHAKIKTPERYLIKDGRVKDFDDLQRRFSVEVVNKDFYREIARFFIRLVGGDTKLRSKTEHFKPELNLPSVDPNDHKTYQEYAVRLIGRIIFCWFLKQKRSQEGISLLPEEFLSSEAVKNTENYYHTTLEPVFFEVLNKPRESRKTQFRNGYDKIPYLNGGLFDPHYDDFYEGQPSFILKIPNDWFMELFEVLETYNFTIDENTSLDVDLSIDPEMLGRIFENLLAEINPETGESARKSTGSYYTPRQIVEYMVDQSLLQHLLTKTEINTQKLEALISVDSSDDEQFPLDDKEKRRVVNALDEVKIIDPACGSGAFPIGILQKIVWILGKVDTSGRLWFDKKLEGLDPLFHDDFKQKFQNENFDYIRKTGVIRDSIYGVDIQPIAVEVSKLRSFLTLIVDEDIDETLPNRGIKPLPNLEFKFVAANSLIPLEYKHTLFEEQELIQKLKRIREEYFNSNGNNKSEIIIKFQAIQNDMLIGQIDKKFDSNLTRSLSAWKPFENRSTCWFDSEWMFGIDKFDIVIANPPYVDSEHMVKHDPISREKIGELFSTTKGNWDLYIPFWEIGYRLLKESGNAVYITPNKWYSIKYGESLRNLLKPCLLKVGNCNKIKVFDAGNSPVVTIVSKEASDSLEVDLLKQNTKHESNKIEKSLIKDDWGFLLSSHIDLIIKIASARLKVGDIGKTENPCSVSEAYELTAYIKDNDNASGCFKFVNTGTIDPYKSLWGEKATTYIKKKYNFPVVEKDFLKSIYPRRYNQFSAPKLIISGMRNFESFYDEGGNYMPGKSTLMFKSLESKNNYSLLGIFNSKLIKFYIKESFGALGIGGGINFTSELVDNLPLPDDFSQITEKLVSDLISLDKINELVYKLYSLTPEEIKIIEDSVK